MAPPLTPPLGATTQTALAPQQPWRHRGLGATGGSLAPFVAVSAFNQRKPPQTAAIVSTSAAGVEIAFDLKRSLEDGGGSGREVPKRAPSRTNGVPDDAPDCPSPI
eukprot:COSAG02_NODE_3309_length_6958_cov_41.260534_4_plen_106_part_00